MTESFSIRGNKESDSDKEDDVALAATSYLFNGNCNICGKQGHKASECCEKHKIKCEHCGRTGHKKEFCWKLEATKNKRPNWYRWTILKRSVLKLKMKVEKSSFKHLISVMGMSH